MSGREERMIAEARKAWIRQPAPKASTSWLVGHALGAMAYGFVLGMAILGLGILLGILPA